LTSFTCALTTGAPTTRAATIVHTDRISMTPPVTALVDGLAFRSLSSTARRERNQVVEALELLRHRASGARERASSIR
jgi:hypothetical protein